MVPCFETEKLNVTFLPSPYSWAFVNGIELVSMPKNMYVNHQENSLTFVGHKVSFDIPHATAFETVSRLNVGGATVGSVDDTGMFRTWFDDTPYIFGAAVGYTPSRGNNVTIKYSEDTPSYIAPAIIYTTSRTMIDDPQINMNFNLTWNFSIDTGFTYLLRLHFCETQLEVTEEGQRVFDIFINNQTAELNADVIHWSGGNSIPVCRDYVLFVPSEGQSKQTLWLALHPSKDVGSKFADSILNGLEIFRLNKSDGSLAVPNPQPESDPSPTLPSVVQEATERDMDMGAGGDEAMVIRSSQTSPLVLKAEGAGGGTTTDDDNEELFSVSGGKASESRSTISSVGRSVSRGDGDRIKSESVFSEFMNHNGR
ncbi:hypothetical protein V6N13_106946 [Hibiscus sabdariffa]